MILCNWMFHVCGKRLIVCSEDEVCSFHQVVTECNIVTPNSIQQKQNQIIIIIIVIARNTTKASKQFTFPNVQIILLPI